jgi:hypothetical protein
LELIAAPILLVIGVTLLAWAWIAVGNFSEILKTSYLVGHKGK